MNDFRPSALLLRFVSLSFGWAAGLAELRRWFVLQALREDVERQMEREKELQQRYGELLMEREALLNTSQKF